jgi:Right handed beta helix region
MTRTILIAAALALAAVLPAVSAQAQSPRTFVSAAGSDSNPCSFAAPCRHFQNAVDATSAGGEVDALDPAGYGPITITQAITIEGQGWSYIAPPAGAGAIHVNIVSGTVTIRGVSLNGVGITGITTGIVFNGGGSLSVQNCVISNFSGPGIKFAPNASSQISVSDTKVSDNSAGIQISALGMGGTIGVLNHVDVENNKLDGITLTTSEQLLNVNIDGSVRR